MENDMLVMSTDDLLDVFRKKFISTHGYNMVYLPTPLTREWLFDQIHALEWYRKYEISTSKTKDQPSDTVVKRSKNKSTNPFI